ncbi:hypothetical protein ACO2Q0_01810 [Phenylobacterium sp. VNQ135]|uniref:hypothetical protein n=1 Tax=Phenylobacterium sp. VNQ135 TaxID=3400922 RepID=UPI003BFC5BFF
MKRRIAITGLALLMAGCQPSPAIYVLNNSGMELRVRASRREGESGWVEKIVSIKPGAGETFRYVKALSYPDGSLRVQIGGCEVTYDVPPLAYEQKYKLNTFGFRLDRDLTVHQILPERPERLVYQFSIHPDFPLKPASRVCPAGGA